MHILTSGGGGSVTFDKYGINFAECCPDKCPAYTVRNFYILIFIIIKVPLDKKKSLYFPIKNFCIQY
jgi:hypothetical protein